MKKFELFLLLLFSLPSFAFDCHPKINPNLPQYIVGYGSLIDETSKKRTDPYAEESFPVLIKGYKRIWAGHGNLPGVNTTFLSAIKNKSSSFIGVSYQLDNPSKIRSYDKRESIYCREQINPDNLVFLSQSSNSSTQKQVWIYTITSTENQLPSKNFPIVQSYVDIFLRGCIQIEEKFKITNFAKKCIETTEGWPVYWINDRIFPRRPSLYQPFAAQIDTLLKDTIPGKFKHISFENAVT
ncbi:gamma-glutamylcyclotransferase family protein [Legionella sp. WA2022007384]